MFNETLTQEDLHILTQISRGTISETLRKLVEQNEINMTLNSLSKKKEYSLNPHQTQSSIALSKGKDTLEMEIQFFTTQIPEIHKNLPDSDQGKYFFLGRINQIILTYELLAYVSEWIMKSLQDPTKSNIPLSLDNFFQNLPSCDPQTQYSPQLLQVEQKILQHLQENQILRHHSEITAEILAYFYLRGVLTQEEIKTLTHFSSGRISQTIKELEHYQYIQKALPKKRPYHYTMPSILHANLHLLCNSINLLLKWQDKLTVFQSKLKAQESILSENVTFQKMSRFISGVFVFIPIYERTLEELIHYS
jgi:DNA-binding transcriptional regulator GbsR (MarR family)